LFTKNKDGERGNKLFQLTDLSYVKRVSKEQCRIAQAQIRAPSGTNDKNPASAGVVPDAGTDSDSEVESPPRKQSKNVPVAPEDIDPFQLMREMSLKEKSSLLQKAQEDVQADGKKAFFFFQCLDHRNAEGKNVNCKTGSIHLI
jgi:hypothetical protein